MAKPSGPQYIRRCIECGNKTHQMYWEGMKCPICKEATGFKESRHGGLKKPKIELVKKSLKRWWWGIEEKNESEQSAIDF